MSDFFEVKELDKSLPFFLFSMDSLMLGSHHWHKEVELIYIKKGKLELGINDKTFEINEGELCIINSGEIHYFFPCQDCIRLVIQFDTSIFENKYFQNQENYDFKNLIDRTPSISSMWEPIQQNKVSKLILEMEKEYSEKLDGYQFAIKARMFDLILAIIRELPKESSRESFSNTNRISLQKIEKILIFVEENFMEPLVLEDAASYIGFTTSYFAEFFKKHTGISFVLYLNKFRITRSQQYLLSEDISITEISYRVGFSNVKTFNRLFKKEVGCSPTHFKKQNLRIKD